MDAIAALRDRLIVAPSEPAEIPTRPAKRRGDLGPVQIAWCRANLHGFATDNDQAIAAREHSERVKAAVVS